MRVANGLYLDNKNQFHTGPLPNAPVYQVGGGLLSITAQTTKGLVSGTLAILPLTAEPGWQTFLRGKGLSEANIALFGKLADVVAMGVTIIGMAPAAFKIAEMLGIMKAGKSVEQLAREILTKLSVVQEMVADTQGAAVRTAIDTSASNIAGRLDQIEDQMKLLVNLDVAGRKAVRAQMLAKVDEIDTELRAVLSPTRWELFNQSKQYRGSWAFMSDPEENEIYNPPYWGTPRYVPRVRMSDDGNSWIPAEYPPAYKLRFDYRAALPFALQGAMSYITALTMAEPEFRSTARARSSLTAFANSINGILQQMRAGIVRSSYAAFDFVYAGNFDDVVSYDPDGIFGPEAPQYTFRRPHYYWQVGANDLCAYSDQYFNELAANRPPDNPYMPNLTPHKLGTVDFDWVPQDAQLVMVADKSPRQPIPPNKPHWEISNPQACADVANRQSEEDYFVALQASGYFQLAQLHSTLLHLATDPTVSETVSGRVQRTRHSTVTSRRLGHWHPRYSLHA